MQLYLAQDTCTPVNKIARIIGRLNLQLASCIIFIVNHVCCASFLYN